MPKKVRPYGSAEDAESAGLGRSRNELDGGQLSELASTMPVREIAIQAAEAIRALNDLAADGAELSSPDEVRGVIASLQLMGHGLPQLCEQLARILVAQLEDGQIGPGSGENPDFTILDATEALAAAGQAADMMTAALDEAYSKAANLRSAR